jgi:LEA14-like dessication related protein
MTDSLPRASSAYSLLSLLFAVFITSCATLESAAPEVNLMRLDVQDVTLSHVNLLADLRVFNPNEQPLFIHGVDYTLHLEGIKVFSGKSNMRQTVAPGEYGHMTLRLASAYWDMIRLLNRLPDKADVTFAMQGSIRAGSSRIFAHRFTFDKKGVIPLQQNSP